MDNNTPNNEQKQAVITVVGLIKLNSKPEIIKDILKKNNISETLFWQLLEPEQFTDKLRQFTNTHFSVKNNPDTFIKQEDTPNLISSCNNLTIEKYDFLKKDTDGISGLDKFLNRAAQGTMVEFQEFLSTVPTETISKNFESTTNTQQEYILNKSCFLHYLTHVTTDFNTFFSSGYKKILFNHQFIENFFLDPSIKDLTISSLKVFLKNAKNAYYDFFSSYVYSALASENSPKLSDNDIQVFFQLLQDGSFRPHPDLINPVLLKDGFKLNINTVIKYDFNFISHLVSHGLIKFNSNNNQAGSNLTRAFIDSIIDNAKNKNESSSLQSDENLILFLQEGFNDIKKLSAIHPISILENKEELKKHIIEKVFSIQKPRLATLPIKDMLPQASKLLNIPEQSLEKLLELLDERYGFSSDSSFNQKNPLLIKIEDLIDNLFESLQFY